MKRSFLLPLCLLPILVFGQTTSWIENFDDNTLTGWTVDPVHLRTFQLSEEDQMLKITYTRTPDSWEWDTFNYQPAQPVLVSNTPLIYVQVKSDVSTQLRFKPIYANGSDELVNADIIGNNTWQEVEYHLTNHGGSALNSIYVYLDGGTTTSKSGTVYWDNLRIGDAAKLVKVISPNAAALDTNRIEVTWSSNFPEMVDYYQIYRSLSSGFTPSPATLIDSTSETHYTDTERTLYQINNYKIIAIDTAGNASLPSSEVSAFTSLPNIPPAVEITGTNADVIGLYEKFEILFSMKDATYNNPFNPEEIDVTATFTAPSGKTWQIPGFYDNFDQANQWKVRFAPNESGTWTYRVKAADRDGSGESGEMDFEAVESKHHGWTRVSPVNSHYLIYDDGTSYYPTTVFYPWGVNDGINGLQKLEKYGINLYGYWNINYSGEGNCIESVASGLGRYDQQRCGRMDQIIEWSEARNLKMGFSIWPHDLISSNNISWPSVWEEQNPYQDICTPVDFFEDSLVWIYQEKQYRYLIARWGYSRGLSFWESCNEINGTDGWIRGQKIQEALDWAAKVSGYFRANDPYGRPTTCSKSGGEYWPDLYEATDMPNVHLYENQFSGLVEYPGDPMRSSLWIYAHFSKKFWEEFDKPGIFGEAGELATLGEYTYGSEGYLKMMHNANWVCWASGLSMPPLWWDWGAQAIFTEEVLDQMHSFSKIVPNIPYATLPLTHASGGVTNADLYAMEADTFAFGWIRDIEEENVAGEFFNLNGLSDGLYGITWIHPWTADTVKTSYRQSRDGQLVDIIPALSGRTTDVAFVVKPAEAGGAPAKLDLLAYPINLYSDPAYTSEIRCYLLDSEGMLSLQASGDVSFTLTGPGSFDGETIVHPSEGAAEITFRASGNSGVAQIVASSPGLVSDTVEIVINKFLYIDDFEQYISNADIEQMWTKRYGTDVQIALETIEVGQKSRSMRVDYKIGDGSLTYAGFQRDLEGEWGLAQSLKFWIKSTGSGHLMNIRLYEDGSKYWYVDYSLDADDSVSVIIPFSDFKSNYGATTLDPTLLTILSMNIYKGTGEYGEGTLYFDYFRFSSQGSTAADGKDLTAIPTRFELYQNYPNPFNNGTLIRYALPVATKVKVIVYNTQGQQVAMLREGAMHAGIHEVFWDASGISSGIYFYQVITERMRMTQKCLLVK